MIYVDWIVKNEKSIGTWDVFLMLCTLWGLGHDTMNLSSIKKNSAISKAIFSKKLENAKYASEKREELAYNGECQLALNSTKAHLSCFMFSGTFQICF